MADTNPKAFSKSVLDESLTKPPQDVLRAEKSWNDGIQQKLKGKKVEACKMDTTEPLVAGMGHEEHAFVQCVHAAFNHHVGLCFGPQHIWMLIMQAMSKLISCNSEKVRHMFVNFDGKQKLQIERNQFTKGSPENDWEGCFPDWANQIEEFIGKENRQLFQPKLSTSGPFENAMFDLTLMDSMKGYFKYIARTKCGIPDVNLQGTLDDWKLLRKSTENLRKIVDAMEMAPENWIDRLLEVLDEFVYTYENKKAKHDLFWKSIYKHYNGEGSGAVDTVDGWITYFFPVLQPYDELNTKLVPLATLYERADKPAVNTWRAGDHGVPPSTIPVGVSSTQFQWKYLSQSFDMVVHGGFFGYSVESDDDDKKYFKPRMGWAVGEYEKEKPQQRSNYGGAW